MKRSIVRVVPVALALGFAACATPADPVSEAAGLSVDAPRTWVVEGESVALTVRDASGNTLAPRDVQWISRDPTTVEVVDGEARGRAPGVTEVVARYGAQEDSVAINVRFAQLGSDEIAVRFQGTDLDELRSSGSAWFADRLGGEDQDYSSIFSIVEEDDPEPPEQGRLTVRFPGAPFQGTATLAPLTIAVGGPLDALIRGFEGAHFLVRAPGGVGGLVHAYLADAEATVTLDAVTMPSAPGLRPGSLRGTVTFEARGLEVRDGIVTGTVGDTTVTVYAEFAAGLQHRLFGSSTIELSGPPIGTVTNDRSFPVGEVHRSAFLRQDVGVVLDLGWFYPDPPLPGLFGAEAMAWLPGLDVGTHAIDSVGPELLDSFFDPSRLWANVDLRYSSAGLIDLRFFPAGGNVRVDEYVPATALDFGWVRGTADVVLDGWRNGQATGDRAAFTASFFAPVRPHGWVN